MIDVFRTVARLAFATLQPEPVTGDLQNNIAVKVVIPVTELRTIGEKMIAAADQAAASPA